jgi:hypothetical protein
MMHIMKESTIRGGWNLLAMFLVGAGLFVFAKGPQQVQAQSVTSTVTVTATATLPSMNITPTPIPMEFTATPIPVEWAQNYEMTNGILLGGIILVLIVICATLSVITRKEK